MRIEEAKRKLDKYDQGHVLKYYDVLSEEEKEKLLEQIEETDFSVLRFSRETDELNLKGNVEPLAALRLEEIDRRRSEFYEAGIQAVREGRVGAVMLAGGMGTRLGSEEPKGMYNIGLTRELYIFECQIRNLLEVVEQAGSFVPLYIMTSEKNHDTTKKFLKEHSYFGYQEDFVSFFKQDMAPASDYEGKVYLEAPNRISTSPNGNGGWFSSLAKAGLLEDIRRRGIEWLNVFAVDNVLQRIADPCFVGATIRSGCASGAKVVKKNAPDERVGVMCLEDGRPSIVEYYELTKELMEARDSSGEPAYNFGVILNYIFKEKDLEALIEKRLPLHVVEKKIPYIDENGAPVSPQEPNGYKFESLVLDMVRNMESCLPYEVDREREFAPIKNKTGIDSVESARELLRKNGVVL